MRCFFASNWILLIVLAAFVNPAIADDDDVPVNVTPWPAPTEERFGPNEIPDDIPEGEDAVAKGNVSLTGGNYTFTIDNTTGKATIKTVAVVNVSGGTTIKLPKDAGDEPTSEESALKEHEIGHDTLNKKEYESAAKKVKAAMKGFKGMMFPGKGATPELRNADATKQATAELTKRLDKARNGILNQMETLSVKYDKLTEHGAGKGDGKEKDEDGNIKTVSTEVGIKMALAEKAKANAAGKGAFIPNFDTPFAVADAAPVEIDRSTDLISFASDMDITGAFDPGDPILNATLNVGDMQAIGLQDNGTLLIADTNLQIVGIGGELLMDAVLFELAYMTSVDPAFGGMIQGFLDVPPVFAGGIDPDFGSDFLNGMLAATDAGNYTMFTLFTPELSFDSFGNLTSDGFNGKIALSRAVPEPSTLVLFVFGFAVLGLLKLPRKAC